MKARPTPLQGALLLCACLLAGPEALFAEGGAALPPALGGDRPLDSFPESAKLRASLFTNEIAGPREGVLARRPKVYVNEYGSFRLSSLRSGEAFYAILAAAKGRDFPTYAQGSWIFKRTMDDGRFIQAKLFLKSDPACFIRIYPWGDRSRMDLVLYGAVLNKDITLPVPFETAIVAPLSDIIEWSSGVVDWALFSPRPGDYEGLLAFSAAIRRHLQGLRYVDDGGLDAEGRAIFIATGRAQTKNPGLNCSGFAQWVVDGLLSPLGADLPGAAALSEKHPELRAASVDPAIEARFDPFFGLDWTRNLGAAAADAREPSRAHSVTENDIRLEAFALFSSAADPMTGGLPYDHFPAYDVDSGYPIRGLKALLYLLAVNEPGNAYLASVSRMDTTGLRRHYHVALLLPYFSEDGNFRVDLFESAAETSLGALLARAPGDYVHLVRLSPGYSGGAATTAFSPPRLP